MNALIDATEPWMDVVLDCWRRGQGLGAVGPGDVSVHLRHASALTRHLRSDDAVGLDLGTGAGVPGLALAGLRQDMEWVLLDAAKRRVAIVQDAIEALHWTGRVHAVHGRAEERGTVTGRRADVVIARLFGPPAATAECAAPLVRVGGRVLVTEPPSVGQSIDASSVDMSRWDPAGLEALGLALGPRHVDPNVQELVAVDAPQSRFPRKPGVAVRRPLW